MRSRLTTCAPRSSAQWLRPRRRATGRELSTETRTPSNPPPQPRGALTAEAGRRCEGCRRSRRLVARFRWPGARGIGRAALGPVGGRGRGTLESEDLDPSAACAPGRAPPSTAQPLGRRRRGATDRCCLEEAVASRDGTSSSLPRHRHADGKESDSVSTSAFPGSTSDP